MRHLALAAILTLGCAAARRGEGLDVATIPPGLRADYELFTHRCSRCHSISRPLTARVTDVAHWTVYVERMRRQPDSMITAEEGTRIVRFLTWYTAPDGGAP